MALQVSVLESTLLILHYVNSLLKPEGKFAFSGLPLQAQKHKCIENTAAALKVSRDADMLIIYVTLGYRPGYPEMGEKTFPMLDACRKAGAFIRNTWDAEVVDELKPLPSEVRVINYNTSAFSHTELDLILRARGIRSLFLAGQVTTNVVESTTRYGVELGYDVTILEDCCTSFTDEMHDFAIAHVLPQYANICRSADFVAALRK